MTTSKRHLSICKAIIILLLIISLLLLFGDQLSLNGNAISYKDVFFNGNSDIDSSIYPFIGYLLYIIPLVLETLSFIYLLRHENKEVALVVLLLDIFSFILIIPSILLIAFTPSFCNGGTHLGIAAIFSILIAAISMLVLIYIIVMDILLFRAKDQDSHEKVNNKYEGFMKRIMNLARGALSITMITGGVMSLGAFFMFLFPQLTLESGESFTLSEIYSYVINSGSFVFPFFIYVAYPSLLIAALIMIIVPLRTFLRKNKNAEKKKIKMRVYVTAFVFSAVAIASVSSLPAMIEGSSLSWAAITMISVASSGAVIALRKLFYAVLLSIPRLMVNIPKLKENLRKIESKTIKEVSLGVTLVGIFLVLIPLTSNEDYLYIGILILGLIVTLITDIVFLNKEKTKPADIFILIFNLITLGLTYLLQYAVYGEEIGVTIGLLLIRIVVVAVIVFAMLGIVSANNRKKIDNKKEEEISQNAD